MTIRTRVDALTGKAIGLTRQALQQAATVVAVIPTSTRDALATGRRMGHAAGEATRVLAEAQLGTLEVVAGHSAKRLLAASEASSLDGLVSGQLALNAEAKDAALTESRKYLALYFDAKARWDEAVKGRVLGLVTPKARPRKLPARAKAAA